MNIIGKQESISAIAQRVYIASRDSLRLFRISSISGQLEIEQTLALINLSYYYLEKPPSS